MRLVLNASPIICLAKAGLLIEVLSMAQEVAVPQTVADEILALDDGRDAAVTWIRTETA